MKVLSNRMDFIAMQHIGLERSRTPFRGIFRGKELVEANVFRKSQLFESYSDAKLRHLSSCQLTGRRADGPTGCYRHVDG
ncbi:hypothetical protein EYF80_000561 [Liparis tanakae]|uniref:Uncharacterized protein n=1 Tax=Liparis tanakae TaxID=230148 RepID=A0A4Z2JHJ0_9TELE|nr:hypothetical protein EYF80_000561 [Liparis tanakae]